MEESAVPISFKAAEAISRDIGKAIIRIDRKEIAQIGRIGDIVEIKGKSAALARMMPLFEEYRGRGLMQLDGILRRNAGVGLDEKVSISPVRVEEASFVVLVPTDKSAPPHNSEDIGRLKAALDGIPVYKGNYVRGKSLGYASAEYLVAETRPEGAVRIMSDCAVRIKNENAVQKGCTVSYEDIGGLDRQVQRIREMIELPLKYPEIFNRLGIEAPKGLLLYGPPGTGKTLIARAVANETDAYFIHVNGPEIINKFYGESEAKLREIFETAGNNAPSIIFLDEIDAISPKRESVNGDVEKRVVAQLLALMDGLVSRGQVIVIGATNIPNAIDPALRRPGRFDREIEVGIPDKTGRLMILKIHTRDMPLAHEVNLNRLAELTHGYVGADLQFLCREAAMSALRKIFPEIDFASASIPYQVIENLKVTMEDFYASLNEIGPSAVREVFVEVPNIGFDEIGGLTGIKNKIKKSVVWPRQYKELYEAFGCRAPKGILFHGAPGTGKTLLAKAIASMSQANFISVKGPALLSKWVGESEKNLREIFKKAKQAAPCILFFDEIESLAPARSVSGDSGTTERMICQMLSEIDGIEDLHGVTVIGATNRPDMIDPALLRPGRFDMLLEFTPPDETERAEIFKIHLKGKPAADDVDPQVLARMTEGATGADIMRICENAALLALTDYIENRRNADSGEPKAIRMIDFQNAIESR